MKFTLLTALLSLASIVSYGVEGATSTIELKAVSNNSAVNGLGLSSVHEGAGINYFFLGQGSEKLTYDGVSTIYVEDSLHQTFQVDSSILELSVTTTYNHWTFDNNNYLALNGSTDGFYACKNFNDPYSYSSNEYGVLTEKVNSDCLPIKISKA
ncbi:hypothetical protein PACTADRAFT_1144 [Pachysolen tannophilus NRRL Y-2460]|uniref:DUF7907 domain-containing protein n=1 Tax=Pachysolen tannophilus NRRL Y-2460 TaxID=669874 RepID=A0A1E4TXS3_PACTA|nr:hypothetical protein PACTADRAFT_1144 [Pachysolen tannophilus NRRL Y-2460]